MLREVPVSRVRTLFLQSVSLCFTFAFHSLYLQIPGLYGEHGILPARSVINEKILSSSSTSHLLSTSPSLLWLAPLLGLPLVPLMELLALTGTLLSLLVTLLPSYNIKMFTLMQWLLYLSLFQAGQTFLHFQWDILLLETGLLAVLASPVSPGQHSSPLVQDSVTLYLVRWLLFRMMFASGVVKLTSGCEAWWGLTAMPTHYFSQCLPSPLAWHAALLPAWIHKLSVLSTFIIEIPLTFFFFAPSSALRKLTFYCQVILMAMIMMTGNYNFFNILYIGLCLSLADDSWITRDRTERKSHPALYCCWCLAHLAVCLGLGWFIGQSVSMTISTSDLNIDTQLTFTRAQFDQFLSYSVPAGAVLGAGGLLYSILSALRAAGLSLKRLASVSLYTVLAVALFSLSLPSYSGQLDRKTYDRIPASIKTWDSRLRFLELNHGYGLFRSMTGIGGRPEVILEGADSIHGPWLEYDFLYKPGNVSSAPQFLSPHQPRLDWQMWFAALGSYQHNPWLLSLVFRLLEGRREVLDLMSPNSPFNNRPAPKFIRGKLYKYHFETKKPNNWWRREYQGEYLPVLSVDNDQLVTFLSNQGYIAGQGQGDNTQTQSFLQLILATIRALSKSVPPHIQIWSYAWLCLPALLSIITNSMMP